MGRFLAIFCTTAALGVSGLIAFNFAVDPFGVWRPGTKPLSTIVAGDIGLSRLVKNHWVRHQDPEVALFGNSHAATAFQTEHFETHLGTGEVFNMALVGAAIEELVAAMKHVIHVTDARDFIVVLDVLNFRLIDTQSAATQFHRAVDDSLLSRYFYLRDFSTTTFSRAATARSLLVMHSGYPGTHSRTGFVLQCAPSATGAKQRRILDSAALRKGAFEAQRESWEVSGATASKRISELVGFAQAHDARITFLLPPFNVAYYYVLTGADLWSLHQGITTELVNTIEASGMGDTLRVLDFSAAHPMTTQASVRLEDSIDYWVDADHFNCALADHVVKRVAELNQQDGPGTQATEKHSFGTRVTVENLHAHLRAVEESWNDWQHSNPEKHRLFSRRILGQANNPDNEAAPTGPR